LVFDAALEDMVADENVQVTAANNTVENFGVVFPEMFQRMLLSRMDRNEKVIFKYLDDDELAADVVKVYATLAQARARVAYQEHCPVGELLAGGGRTRTWSTSRPCVPAPSPARSSRRWRPPASRPSLRSPTAATAARC